MDANGKPKTIKGLDETEWERFTASARRLDLSMAEWITRAGRTMLDRERRLDPAVSHGEVIESDGRALVVSGQTRLAQPANPAQMNMAEVLEGLRALKEITGEVPPYLMRRLRGVLAAQMRGLRKLDHSANQG